MSRVIGENALEPAHLLEHVDAGVAVGAERDAAAGGLETLEDAVAKGCLGKRADANLATGKRQGAGKVRARGGQKAGKGRARCEG